jgi:hypothetical protein
MDQIIREARQIELHPNNINREDGFSLSRSWKPLICDLREQKQAMSMNMMPPVGPEKGLFLLLLNSLPTPHPRHNLPEGSLLVQILFPYSFSLTGSLPSAFAPQVLYKPSTSLLCHFSPEDGDSTFL